MSDDPRPGRAFLRAAAVAAAAALLVLAVFSAAPPARFLEWDDAANLLTNPRWRGLTWDSLRWMWTTHFNGPWQPLSWLSWAADDALWGLDPAAFRRVNVLLHALNAALLAFAARRVLAAVRPALPERSVLWGAAAAALAFGLHPLRVESVLWITERRDVLSGLFALAAILAWLHEERGWSAAAFAAALLSKGTAVAVVPFLLALDRRRWRALWPHVLLAAGAAAMNLRGFSTGDLHAAALAPADRLLVAGWGAWFYLLKTVLPVGLSPYYALPADLTGSRALLALGAGAALAATAACLARPVRAWAAPAWLAYAAALAPVSGLLQNGRQAAADRYSYLPCLPFALLAGAGLARLHARRPRAAAALLAAAALALSALTVRQSRVWADDVTLWTRAVALDPRAYLPRSNLAQALFAAGRGAEAEPQFEAAIRLEPRDAEARVNLGTLREARGDRAGAEALYREALALKPGSVEAATNLAGLRAVAGDFKGAVAILAAVVALRPDFAPARFNLGALLVRLGRKDEGLAQVREAVRLDPSLAARLPRRR